MKKINVIMSILDEIRPDDLFHIEVVDSNGQPITPTDQASFEQLCRCTSGGQIDAPLTATWADVEANYAEHESRFALAEMREQRDVLLKESDVEVLPDRTPSDDILAYRQALRDLPSTETPTYNADGELQVNWPTKP
jgi:hypothetical protein